MILFYRLDNFSRELASNVGDWKWKADSVLKRVRFKGLNFDWMDKVELYIRGYTNMSRGLSCTFQQYLGQEQTLVLSRDIKKKKHTTLSKTTASRG